MPGREYLLKGLEDKDVQAYLEYQISLATLLGADKEKARKEQTLTVEFEIELAKVKLLSNNLFNSTGNNDNFFYNNQPDKSPARRAP